MTRDGKLVCRGVYQTSSEGSGDVVHFGMTFRYLEDRFLGKAVDQTFGFGPLPAGPTGLQRSQFKLKVVSRLLHVVARSAQLTALTFQRANLFHLLLRFAELLCHYIGCLTLYKPASRGPREAGL